MTVDSIPGQRDADLQRFRQLQALCYECVTAIERELEPGVTEIEVAARMEAWLRGRGVRQWFHVPFAWFGDRTAFEGRLWNAISFFPTRRRLERGMPVILDVAPTVDGYSADIGYACRLGDNRLHERMLMDLEPYRDLILRGVRAEKTLAEIYRDVNALITRQGYQNRHARYPYRVLAHRVDKLAPSWLERTTVAGFGVPALQSLGQSLRREMNALEKHSPLWNERSAFRATPGLWAVEPHIGFRGVGVKWEELLVVTDSDAYWLDDDLPHVTRWKSAGGSQRRAVDGHASQS